MPGDKGGGKPATTNTVTNNSPWSGAVPYINTGLEAASNLYNQGGPAYYSGNTYAGPNSTETGAVAGLSNLGSNSGLGVLNDYASGKYLTADNPYFSQMADTVKANVLPSINAQFANAGRGVSGLAARAASEGLGDSIGGLAYQNYQQGLQQQQSAAQSFFGDTLAAQQAQLGAGQVQQGWAQDQINADKARYDYNANLPYQNLQNYIANISGQTQGTGSSSSNQTAAPAQPSFFNQLLGAGLTAASFLL